MGLVLTSVLNTRGNSSVFTSTTIPTTTTVTTMPTTTLDLGSTILTTTSNQIPSVVIIHGKKRDGNIISKVDLYGEVDNNFELKDESDSHINGACSVVYNNEFYIYGSAGTNKPRRILSIQNCSIQVVGQLDERQDEGACAVGRNYIYLCFSWTTNDDGDTDLKTCYKSSDPLGKFNEIATRAIYEHKKIQIESSSDIIISCGSRRQHKGESHNKCEVLNLDNDKWQNVTDYPYAEFFAKSAVISVNENFIYFGGECFWCEAEKLDQIACLDGTSFLWSLLGKLNRMRMNHNAIKVNKEYLIIGGSHDNSSTIVSERCSQKDNKLVCIDQPPVTVSKFDNPHLFEVRSDYCST